MELLIVCLCFGLLAVIAAMFLYLTRIEKIVMDLGLKCVELGESHKDGLAKLSISVQHQFNDLEKRANPPAHVSDPFKGQKQVFQSTKHIVVPKTPDEIRAQNFAEIQKGAEYGQVE